MNACASRCVSCLPLEIGGCDVEASARELSELADLTIGAALAEARQAVFRRFGAPCAPDGRGSAFTVIGMGKLGGRELNAGSDVDLVCFYDSDTLCRAPSGAAPRRAPTRCGRAWFDA